MRSNLQKAMKTIFKISPLSALTADEMTDLTWAKAINSYAAVPMAYRAFFDVLMAAGQPFPYTVATPSRTGFIHRTTEKLICQIGDDVHVLERKGESYTEQCYPIEWVSHIEIGIVLLDAWFRICGMTREGVFATSTLRFNSINDYLFAPLLRSVRRAGGNSGSADAVVEAEKFEQLIQTNYKFMNYARRSLLAGDRVVQFHLQPEILVGEKIPFLGKTFFRRLSPTHMTILTERELILIREDPGRWDVKYGGIWDYIPLKKINSMDIRERGNNLFVLSVALPEGTRLELTFPTSAKEEIERLIKAA
jgi:hypothetical protein